MPTAKQAGNMFDMLSLAEGLDEEGEGEGAPTFDPLNFEEDLQVAHGEFKHNNNEEITKNLRALQSFLRETSEEEEGEEEGAENFFSDMNGDSTVRKVEQFENALAGLKKLRDSAQQLPDEKRKALAAQVITMLFPGEGDWQ